MKSALALFSALILVGTVRADSFSLTYVFDDYGQFEPPGYGSASATFDGDSDGQAITNISNIVLTLFGQRVAGDIQVGPASGGGPVPPIAVDVDPLACDFAFYSADNPQDVFFVYQQGASSIIGMVYDHSLMGDDALVPDSWSLMDMGPSAPETVPDNSSTAVLLGFALVGIAAISCLFAQCRVEMVRKGVAQK